MIDSIQILLAVVISVLTILLTIIGLAVYQILREFKKSIAKINLVLDDARRMSSAVAQPVEDASDLIHGVKKGISLAKTVSQLLKKESGKKIKESGVEVVEEKDKFKKKKKFFQKNGKSLKKPS
jgi:hypothetical protein